MLKRMSLKKGRSKCIVFFFFSSRYRNYHGKPEQKVLYRLLDMCTCVLCVHKHVLTKRFAYNIFTIYVQCIGEYHLGRYKYNCTNRLTIYSGKYFIY